MVIGGGTGPVDLAGTLVQTNAEILAGIVLAQLTRKGVPVIYASFSTGMDLKVGAAPLGSPETAIIAAAVADLCQYYQIPCMVPGMSSDKASRLLPGGILISWIVELRFNILNFLPDGILASQRGHSKSTSQHQGETSDTGLNSK